MTPQSLEAQVIARVAEDYRRRGYDVDVVPEGARVPEFLGAFQPDLIARSPAESVVVEVKVGTGTSVAERFREVAERVNRQPGWRFSLVFVNPDQPDEISEAEPAPLSLLRERVRNADILLQTGQLEAALLLFFSALEGLLRLLGQRAQLPLQNLPPSTLIRESSRPRSRPSRKSASVSSTGAPEMSTAGSTSTVSIQDGSMVALIQNVAAPPNVPRCLLEEIIEALTHRLTLWQNKASACDKSGHTRAGFSSSPTLSLTSADRTTVPPNRRPLLGAVAYCAHLP